MNTRIHLKCIETRCGTLTITYSGINLVVSYPIVCLCCHVVCETIPTPIIDNVNYYPFRISGYTMLQGMVMWNGQESVSLMVPMLTIKLRSVMIYHIEGSIVYEKFFTRIHFTS